MLAIYGEGEEMQYRPLPELISEEEAQQIVRVTIKKLKKVLAMRRPVHELPISLRAANTMRRNDLFTLGDLVLFPKAQMKGAGAKVCLELKRELELEDLPIPPVIHRVLAVGA